MEEELERLREYKRIHESLTCAECRARKGAVAIAVLEIEQQASVLSDLAGRLRGSLG